MLTSAPQRLVQRLPCGSPTAQRVAGGADPGGTAPRAASRSFQPRPTAPGLGRPATGSAAGVLSFNNSRYRKLGMLRVG
jgi:hypothetical protein